MRQSNVNFLQFAIGNIIEVRPDLYDRDWTKAKVVKIDYTDVPHCFDGTFCRRYEMVVKILGRENYSTWIWHGEDVREIL